MECLHYVTTSTCHSSTLPSQPAVENLPVGLPSTEVKTRMSTITLLCGACLSDAF